jgi:hypothetical protein
MSQPPVGCSRRGGIVILADLLAGDVKSSALNDTKHPSFDPTTVTVAADPSFAQTQRIH